MTRVKPRKTLRAACRMAAAAALAGLLAAAPARAQEEPADAPAGVRYEVELIVFRHVDARATTPEAEATAGGAPAAPGVAWPALAPDGLRLAGVAARMRRGPYQVLWHGGWVQPVENQDRAPASAVPAAGVYGTVTLYRERFLHVLLDLGLAAGDGGTAPVATLRQGRRLKNPGAHYFDGPVLGVILQARPVAPPAGDAIAGAPPPG